METLDKLGFVTYCARKVSVSGDKQQNAYSSNIGLYFPSFVLCLRDFSHDLDKETPNAYLERMLTLKNDDEKESYNQIRACIRNFFQKRECFIFDTPVSGRKNLAKLESSDEKDLLESFKEDSHKFIESITKNKPKELLDGKNMNGSMFSSLVKAYVNMFNVDGIPCIDSALTTMATHENMIVVKNVAESFRIELNKNKLPVYNEKKLQELYQRARERVNKEFRLKCVLIIEKPVDDELKKHIDEIWKEYNDKNIRTQKEGCVSAMENMYGSEIKKKMNEGIYGDEGGYSKYAEDLDHIKSQTRQNFRDMDDTLFKECFSEFRDDHRDDMIMMTISEQSRKKLKDQHDTEMRQFQEQFEKKFQAEKEKYRALDVEHEKQRSIDEANYKRKIEEAVKKWETDKSELLEKLQKEEKRAKCLLSMLKIELDANEPTIMKIIARGTSSLLPVIGPVIFDAYRKKKHKERREKYRKQINEML